MEVNNDYRGLKNVLYVVRLSQHYTAVVAEVLILLAFAMSGLDVSLGGKLAAIPGLAVMWGIAFAIGIDTSFVLAWVRIRQVIASKLFGHLWYAIPLAIGMSFIVFEPTAIQQLQQSMGISFNAALASLGIDLNFLVLARAGVAVALGAILAMTNTERDVSHVSQPDVTVSPVSNHQVKGFMKDVTLSPVVSPPVTPLSLPSVAVSHEDVSLDAAMSQWDLLLSHDVAVDDSLSHEDVAPVAGMTVKQEAELRGVSVRTVQRQRAKGVTYAN